MVHYICVLLHPYYDFYGTMVRTEDVGMDLGAYEIVVQAFRADEIVYAPPCVLLPCLESV